MEPSSTWRDLALTATRRTPRSLSTTRSVRRLKPPPPPLCARPRLNLPLVPAPVAPGVSSTTCGRERWWTRLPSEPLWMLWMPVLQRSSWWTRVSSPRTCLTRCLTTAASSADSSSLPTLAALALLFVPMMPLKYTSPQAPTPQPR